MKTIKRKIKRIITKLTFRSYQYWDERYKTGGDSGAGSYDVIAEFKTKVINEIILKNKITKIIDLGCGDGNQTLNLNTINYIGFDVSPTAINICKSKYKNDKTKNFYLYVKKDFQIFATDFKPELILSLDVIYHLVEDEIFEEYINNLFNYSKKYVLIFSTDYDRINEAIHHRDRKFTHIIEYKFPDWKLLKKIDNPLKGELSLADFYFYERINQN